MTARAHASVSSSPIRARIIVAPAGRPAVFFTYSYSYGPHARTKQCMNRRPYLRESVVHDGVLSVCSTRHIVHAACLYYLHQWMNGICDFDISTQKSKSTFVLFPHQSIDSTSNTPVVCLFFCTNEWIDPCAVQCSAVQRRSNQGMKLAAETTNEATVCLAVGFGHWSYVNPSLHYVSKEGRLRSGGYYTYGSSTYSSLSIVATVFI